MCTNYKEKESNEQSSAPQALREMTGDTEHITGSPGGHSRDGVRRGLVLHHERHCRDGQSGFVATFGV